MSVGLSVSICACQESHDLLDAFLFQLITAAQMCFVLFQLYIFFQKVAKSFMTFRNRTGTTRKEEELNLEIREEDCREYLVGKFSFHPFFFSINYFYFLITPLIS